MDDEAASAWQQAQGHQQGVGQIVDMRSSAGVEDAVQAAVQAAMRTASQRLEAAIGDLERQAIRVREQKSVWPQNLVEGFLAAFDDRRKSFLKH